MKLEKTYNPKETEDKIYRLWEQGGFFKPRRGRTPLGRRPFVIMIPPPNITGSLHMGHALNNTVQDILIRYHRMKKEPTLWQEGLDHAGIATQVVVEKELKKEGPSRVGGAEADKTRFDLGREKFIKRIWKWKEKYGHIIIDQLKKLGCSCDWSRQRFTLDKEYQEAVKTAFWDYYKKGWIYRGERVINFCPRCQTSLSDLEIEYKETKGKLWFIRYTLNAKRSIVVATTRPETMLGDTAVAVNPKDKRYKKLVGQKIILPLMNRKIPIIADNLVDPKFGTGAVKVTPAHDPNDFELGEKYGLEKKQVIGPDGRMTKLAGKYAGLKVMEARKQIVEDMKKIGILEKTKLHTHNIARCYRCNTVLEPILSKQWFLKMDELAKMTEKVIKEEKIKFIPKRFKKISLDWLKNIKDWCISRQIWWGHRLPVWQSKFKIKNEKLKIDFYIGDNPPKGYIQVEDVLDTWFSSALWPFATLGWPQNSNLNYFYPTSVLTTGRDILFLWVLRMIFSGLFFMKEIPFKIVYIHPTVLTETGRRMSKSLGTGVDPLLLIEKYGADATRFGIAWQLSGGQDLRFKVDTMIAARNFANKIWNASRFVLLQIGKSEILSTKSETISKFKIQNSKHFTTADKKILLELEKVKKSTNKDLENFRFGKASQGLYHFFWHQFCDKYIEVSKKQMQDKRLRENTQKILLYTLSQSLKLLHPFVPFITEEIWQKLPGKKEPLIISKWPKS